MTMPVALVVLANLSMAGARRPERRRSPSAAARRLVAIPTRSWLVSGRNEPRLPAWQELRQAAFAGMKIPDRPAVFALRCLAMAPMSIDEQQAAGFYAAARDPAVRDDVGMDGVTDPIVYQEIPVSCQS